MHKSITFVGLWVTLCVLSFAEGAAAVRVKHTDPSPAGSMPQFEGVPFPNNLCLEGGAPGSGDFTHVRLKRIQNSQGTTFKLSIQAAGAFDLGATHEGGGGTPLQLEIDGVPRNSSGGKCATSETQIVCSRTD